MRRKDPYTTKSPVKDSSEYAVMLARALQELNYIGGATVHVSIKPAHEVDLSRLMVEEDTRTGERVVHYRPGPSDDDIIAHVRGYRYVQEVEDQITKALPDHE